MIDFVGSAFSSNPQAMLLEKVSNSAGLAGVAIFFLVVAIVSICLLVLKGFALWRAARRGDKGWFIAMLVINLFGVLEIIYLLIVSKKSSSPVVSSEPVAKISFDKH